MESNKKKKILSFLWEVFKSFVLTSVRDYVVKNIIKNILKVVGKSNFFTWISTVIAENFYDEIMEPLIKAGLVEIKYTYHKAEGKILIKRLKEAGNVEDYNSTVDDILS